MATNSTLILIILLIIQNRLLALASDSKGLECFECLSFGNEGDPTCESGVIGTTQVVPCNNGNDAQAAEKLSAEKYRPLITKIQEGRQQEERRKRNADADNVNNSNTDVEAGQPICYKLSFMSNGKPVVVRGCKLADTIAERTTGCSLHPDGKTTECICTENCVPSYVKSGKSQLTPGNLITIYLSIITLLLLLKF